MFKSNIKVFYYNITPQNRNYTTILGLGWAMVVNSIFTAIYYNIIVAWTLIYIVIILIGKSHYYTSCNNFFNTIYCSSMSENDHCAKEKNASSDETFFFNHTCFLKNNTEMWQLRNETYANYSRMSPAEEFFK